MSSETHPMTDELVKESHLSTSAWFRQFDHHPLICTSELFSFHLMQNVIKAKNFPFSLVPSTSQSAEIHLNCSHSITAPLVDGFFDKALTSGAKQLTFPFLFATAGENKQDKKTKKEAISPKDLRGEWERRMLQDIRTSKRLRTIYMRPGIRHRVLISTLGILPPNVFSSIEELPFLFRVLLSGGDAERVHQDLPVWPAERGLMEYAPSGVWLGLTAASSPARQAIVNANRYRIGPSGLLMAIYLYLHRRLSLARTDVRYIDGLLQSAMHACIVRSVRDERGNIIHPNSLNGPFDKVTLKLYFNPRDLSKVQQDNSRTNIKLTEDIHMIRSYMDNASRNRPMPLEFVDCLYTGMLYEQELAPGGGSDSKKSSSSSNPTVVPSQWKWTRRNRIEMKSVVAVHKKLCVEHDNFLQSKRFSEFVDRMAQNKTPICLFELEDCSSRAMNSSFFKAFPVVYNYDQVFITQYTDKPAPDICCTKTLVGMSALSYFVYIRWASYYVIQEIISRQQEQIHAYTTGTGGLLGIAESVRAASFAPTLCQLLFVNQHSLVFDILALWSGLPREDYSFFDQMAITLTKSSLAPPERIVTPEDLFDVITDILFCERNCVPNPPSQLAVYLPLLLSFKKDDTIRLSKSAVEQSTRLQTMKSRNDPLDLWSNLDPIDNILCNIINTKELSSKQGGQQQPLPVAYSEFLSGARSIYSIWKFDHDTKEQCGYEPYFTYLQRYMNAFEYKDANGGFRSIPKLSPGTIKWKDVPLSSVYNRDALHDQTANGKPVLENISHTGTDDGKEEEFPHEIWWQLFAAAEQMHEQKQAPVLYIKSPVEPLLRWPETRQLLASNVMFQKLTPETWDTPIAFVTTVNGTRAYFPDREFPVCVPLVEDNPRLEVGDRFVAMDGIFSSYMTESACNGVSAYLEARQREATEYSDVDASSTDAVARSPRPSTPLIYPPSPLYTGMDTSSDNKTKKNKTTTTTQETKSYHKPGSSSSGKPMVPIVTTMQQETTTTTRTSYTVTNTALSSPGSGSSRSSPMCL